MTALPFLDLQRCETPDGSYANCLAASERYRVWAAAQGIRVSVIRLSGHVWLPDGIGRWSWTAPEHITHWICVNEEIAIDWTARQFDPRAAFPIIVSAEEYCAEWASAEVWTCPDCPLDVVPAAHREWAPEGMGEVQAMLAAAGTRVPVDRLSPYPDPRHSYDEDLTSPCRCRTSTSAEALDDLSPPPTVA